MLKINIELDFNSQSMIIYINYFHQFNDKGVVIILMLRNSIVCYINCVNFNKQKYAKSFTQLYSNVCKCLYKS